MQRLRISGDFLNPFPGSMIPNTEEEMRLRLVVECSGYPSRGLRRASDCDTPFPSEKPKVFQGLSESEIFRVADVPDFIDIDKAVPLFVGAG